MNALRPEYATLTETWQACWPRALGVWSRFTKLSPPRWCYSQEDEKREGLSGSFAMIRLRDHAVVVSLRQVVEEHVERFGAEILAHEIGHHVYAPGDLLAHGRILARMRRGLPSKEKHAPLIANLYADLLINDRLQRQAGFDLAGVYQALPGDPRSRLWRFYVRIYEVLWSLPKGTLARGEITNFMELDATLGARLIRSYARDWLDGAGRFAALCLPYLLESSDDGEDEDGEEGDGECEGECQGGGRASKRKKKGKGKGKGKPRLEPEDGMGGWLDTAGGDGLNENDVPAGLAEVDDGEEDGALHPSMDPNLTGLRDHKDDMEQVEGTEAPPTGRETGKGGKKQYRKYRGPTDYRDLLRALGLKISDHEAARRYYRERAMPNLIPFPTRTIPETTEPQPEGLESWDVGMPLTDIDWAQSVFSSPVVVPGFTTVQRTYGTVQGTDPQRQPIDLYLGVDCSGSMGNPQLGLSYPVLAGAIMALSALRAGSRVMVVLSGESPGEAKSTNGFVRNETEVLEVLTDYLGTGYSFGIHRLREGFAGRKPTDRPAHIIIVSDSDIFSILDATSKKEKGWDVARWGAQQARGGATYVLNMPPDWNGEQQARMRADGWQIHCVRDWEELVAFAKAFSQAHYADRDDRGRKNGR